MLDLVPAFPTGTWGRDDLVAGEMWNSNSLTSWLLARSGHDTDGLGPPSKGRAPGWAAGLAVAERDDVGPPDDGVRRPGSVDSPRRPLERGALRQTVPAEADSAGKRRASSWGVTRAEARAAMPGDELVGAAKYRTTHAVSIDASAEQVWPWLVQMGQGRGGMYSYDWLENIFGLHMHSAQRIDPALQNLTVGDCVRLVPEGTEPALRFAVARVEPPHVLVLGPDTARAVAFAAGLPYPVWTFQLAPTSAATSRLLVRFQSDFKSTARGWIAYKYALKPVHVVMERKMMLGIKQRAERAASAPLPTMDDPTGLGLAPRVRIEAPRRASHRQPRGPARDIYPWFDVDTEPPRRRVSTGGRAARGQSWTIGIRPQQGWRPRARSTGSSAAAGTATKTWTWMNMRRRSEPGTASTKIVSSRPRTFSTTPTSVMSGPTLATPPPTTGTERPACSPSSVMTVGAQG